MNRSVRSGLLVISAFQLIFAALFLIQALFALGLWPFPATRTMTYILLASFFAASAEIAAKSGTLI